MKRILFVDDECAVLDGLRRMLRPHRQSWGMTFVQSAEAALDAVHHLPFDAIVSDVTMPGMDGISLLAEFRRAGVTDTVPVIMLTGNKDRDLKRRALDLGATDLLNKPVEPEDLIARLRSILRLKSLQDELRNHNQLLSQKVAERTAELADTRLQIIWRLGKAAEFRDEDTGNHVARVGCYCREIAETMNLDSDFVELVFLSSPLHDIGKVGVPDRVLRKRGKLNDEEWHTMQQHCRIGAEILRDDAKMMRLFQATQQEAPKKCVSNPLLEIAASIALTHHERWDGKGYPEGLAGEDIPVESRIVTICDVFDALRSERPYKPMLSEVETIAIMRQEIERQFDPSIFEVFEHSIPSLRAIGESLADTSCSTAKAELVS